VAQRRHSLEREGREEGPSLERVGRECKELFKEAGSDGNLKRFPTEDEFNACRKGYKYRFGLGLSASCSVCTYSLASVRNSILGCVGDPLRSRCSHECGFGWAKATVHESMDAMTVAIDTP